MDNKNIVLQPHQERMLVELNELRDKVNKLSIFINENDLFKKLDIEEQKDMENQLAAMKSYLNCLESRCKRQNIL